MLKYSSFLGHRSNSLQGKWINNGRATLDLNVYTEVHNEFLSLNFVPFPFHKCKECINEMSGNKYIKC